MTEISLEIACTLSTAEQRKLRLAYRESLTPFLIDATYSDGIAQLVFSKPEVTKQELERLIAQENSCCGFLKFDLSETETELNLTVTGPKGSEDILRDFFPSPASSDSASNSHVCAPC